MEEEHHIPKGSWGLDGRAEPALVSDMLAELALAKDELSKHTQPQYVKRNIQSEGPGGRSAE
jgi:hypothetical protein